MADASVLVTTNKDGYFESEDHRPSPLFQYGTLDTSDTAGGAHQRVEEVAPVFEVARRQNLATAARALDPEDTEVPAELVTLPTGSVTVTGSTRTADEAKEEIASALASAAEDPLVLGGPTEEQRKAAEATPEAEAEAPAKAPATTPRTRTASK